MIILSFNFTSDHLPPTFFGSLVFTWRTNTRDRPTISTFPRPNWMRRIASRFSCVLVASLHCEACKQGSVLDFEAETSLGFRV